MNGARAGVWRSENRVGGPISRGPGESRVLHRYRAGPGGWNGGRSG